MRGATTVPASSAPDALQHPWQATLNARLVRVVGIDQVEQIDYEATGHFTRRLQVARGATPGFVVLLDRPGLDQLLLELTSELQAAPVGVDALGIRVFITLIEDALRAPPASQKFDSARFGATSRDESRGILYGQVGIGADVIGTVEDARGVLSFEQHPVMMAAGPYRPLSASDAASLARALEASHLQDPLWKEILTDAKSA